MLTIGDIEIHLINDGTIQADTGGVFGLVPKPLWSRIISPSGDNTVPMVHVCLLMRVDGKNVLVDTGLGTKDEARMARLMHLERPNGNLLMGLARLGIKPGDVDMVINTHLHGDHCGGNTYLEGDGTVQATFPNAVYVTQRREYQDAATPNERTRATYLAPNFQPLLDSGQMRLLDGESEFFPGVRGVLTPGHTPGHMSLVIQRGDEAALFVCDLASYAVHFQRLGWMTAYDVEPLATLESKRVWQAWALDHEAILIFPHDPQTPVCKLAPGERYPALLPVHEPFV